MPAWGWALGALILLLLFNLIATPGFMQVSMRNGRLVGSMIDILNRSAPVLLLSLGMTLVIGTGGVDLSVGAVMAIAGTVSACLISRPAGCPLNALNIRSTPLAALGGLTSGALCGLFNGALITSLGLQPIVATLLLMVAGRGIAQLLSSGQVITFQNASFAVLGGGTFLALPTPAWLFAGAAVIIGVLTRRTALGLFVEATGSNARAANYAGVNTGTVKLVAYLVSGLCAALAGLIVTADIRAADANNAGLYSELDAILAVSVGGTALTGGRFSLAGSVVGALLMQTLTTTVLTRGVRPEIALVLKALVVLGVCLLQSDVFNLMVRNWRRRNP